MATMTPEQAPPTPSPDEAFEGGRPMTIIEHLQELRTRLIWCAVGLVAGIVISAFFTGSIFDVLTKPLRDVPDAELIYTRPLEGFTQLFRVALLGGMILAMPVFVYQTLMFVLPGLTRQERRWVIPGVLAIFGLFLLGVLFAYYVTLPPAMRFLLAQRPGHAKPQIIVGEYVSFVTKLVFWVGVTFETPLFMLVLARFGLVSGRQLLGWWRYIVVLVFIVAAIVTPTPDPLTQTLVAGPLLVLYLVGVGLAFLFGRQTEGRGRILKRLRRDQR